MGNETIISSSKTIFYKDEKGKDIGLEVTYRAWRDFEGNIKSQFFLDKDNQPSLGMYIFKFNRYGIGTESLVVLKTEKETERPLEIASYRNKENLNLKNMKELTYKDLIFFFDVIKMNQLIDLDFNTKDLYQNLSPLKSKLPDLSNPEFIGGRNNGEKRRKES